MSITKSLLKSPTEREAINLLGRLGYGARGAIYLCVGISAGLATFSRDYRPGGVIESLKPLQHHWLGAALIMVLAGGLACLSAWLAVTAILRRDHPGPAHAILVAGTLGDAAIYIGFVAVVVEAAFGATRGGDPEMQSWVAWFASYSGGRVLIGATGAAVFACGAGLMAWATVGDVEGPLSLPRAERLALQPIGRFGTGGRGVAIAAVGVSLCAAAWHGNPQEAHDLGGLLKTLRDQPYGAIATGAFALAFIGSCIADFFVALFRRFDPTDP
ncbi:MAG TPA: DUF1206 domain-containing protein [Stellaceae bacterium]|jgi:hypothetical protein